MDGLWARVGYHGNTNGWVLTANRRGAIFTAVDDDAAAEALWSEQVTGVTCRSYSATPITL